LITNVLKKVSEKYRCKNCSNLLRRSINPKHRIFATAKDRKSCARLQTPAAASPKGVLVTTAGKASDLIDAITSNLGKAKSIFRKTGPIWGKKIR